MSAMTRKQKEREDSIIHEMESCVHFRGIQNPCAVGVDIRALVGGPDLGWAVRIPCLLMDKKKCVVVCESRQLPTREEAEAAVTKSDEAITRALFAVEAAHDDAEAKGLKIGSGGRSSMACPIKCGGTLHYTVASVNGHMHAKCSTDGCVFWVE